MLNPIDYISVESRPIKWLTDNMKAESIIVDYSFQRRYVWILKDKIALIETILLGYPIPEVYLWQNDTDPDTGETIYSLVDGQQRLGAVLSFINDEFALHKSHLENKNDGYAGKIFSALSPEQKSKVWKYPFSIRFISENLSKENIVTLFLRLNKTNATLNPQELRNAEFSGLFICLADDLSKEEFWKKYDIFNSSDYRRMIDIQFISTLLIFLRLGIEEETTQSSINRIYDLYNETYPEAEADREIFINTLRVLSALIENQQFTLSIVKKKSHFYTLFVYSYYLLKINDDYDSEDIANRLNIWFQNYQNESSFNLQEEDALLNEYRSLSQEGVQKRANRQRRFEILREYLNFNRAGCA